MMSSFNAIIPLLVMTLVRPSVPTNVAHIFPQDYFTVGAVLSDREKCLAFEEAIERINNEPGKLPGNLTMKPSCIVMNSNPIVAAEMVCEDVIASEVYVAIASHSTIGELSPMSVAFTFEFYRIPIIGISSRESAFSDKNVHTTFLRTIPPYSEQSVIWFDIVKLLQFKKMIFVHSYDQEGRAVLAKFQNSLARNEKDNLLEIERNIQFIPGQLNYSDALSQAVDVTSRVILLYASEEDAERIYADAERLGLTGSDYAWIVTEQALKPHNTPLGVLGLQFQQTQGKMSAEEAHIEDSVRVIAKSLVAMNRDNINITSALSDCDHAKVEWETGVDMFRYLVQQRFDDGETGAVAFNDNADRVGARYRLLNKQHAGLVAVGSYVKKNGLAIEMESIIWPGNQLTKPKGISIATHLKVLTLATVPFVYATKRQQSKCEPEQFPCSKYNETTGHPELYCCYGYCLDLLNNLSYIVNFTYEVHLSPDGLYGSYERRNDTKKSWNGMIGKLVDSKADMIVAPLTINPERADAIDFTKPFKYQGMTILVKKTTKDSSLASFLQPFQDTLWILVGLSVHVVALVLYLLDRFSPFGRFKLAKSDDTEEDALNLSGAVWFAWGVLLNSGIGEGTPRSFSARVLGMVWAGFAMIIVASYTANLAAFLVLDRPEASISGIDDARLRNPQDNFKYATVKDSAVAMYFKRQVELSTMYRTMEGRYYNNELDAIQAVKTNDLDAFIWDSSRLEYEAANDCDLVTAGELFGRSGYGIGLTKGSPWTEDISLAILNFHETGFMEKLDNKWILLSDTKCPERDASPATLGLTNMAGVFMMVAGGIVAGVFLIFIEIAYKKHRGLKEKELELAKTAADRWRGNIEKRRTLRRTLLQQQQERNKAKNGTTESPAHTRLTKYSPSKVPAGYLPVATNIKSDTLPV